MNLIQSNDNNYLKTILMPYNVKARVPDLDMTSSVLKGVKLVRNISMGDSGELLVVYVPHSKRSVLRLYGWEEALQEYIFWKTIDYDELITDNFELARFVSGAMTIKSATTSGGQFDLSGVISASQYQDLPDIRQLRFENISSFTRDSINTLSTEVQEGIVTLAHPDGSHKFLPYDTNAVYSVDAVLRATNETNDFNDLWLANDNVLFDSDRDPSFVPPNLWGHLRVEFDFCFTSGVSNNQSITLTVEGRKINDNFVGTTTVFNSVTCFKSNNLGEQGSVSNFIQQSSNWVVERVYITVSSPLMVSSLEAASIAIQSNTYYQRGARGPGTIVGLQAVTPQQKIYFNGVGNFEVVPNADLSRNLTTNYAHVENPFDMEMAEVFVQRMPSLGLKMLSTCPEYRVAVSQHIYSMYTDRVKLGQASGFMDWIRSLWSDAKPYVGALAPALGSLMGPEGAIIGSSVGRLLTGPGKASSVYRLGKAGMLGDANYNQAILPYKTGVQMITVRLPKTRVITMGTFTAKGDNFVVASILKTKGIRNSSIINKAIFPYLVGESVHFGVAYVCGDPLASQDGEQTYAGYRTSDGRWIMVTSDNGLDEDAIASVLAAVDYVGAMSHTYVLISAKHPITQGSLGLAVYGAASGLNPSAPVTGAVVDGELYTPSDVEIKRAATNKLGRPLLVAGISPPATQEDLYVAHGLTMGIVTFEGAGLRNIYYLKNPACLAIYSLLQVPASLTRTVSLKTIVDEETGDSTYAAAYKGPQSQAVNIVFPINVDMATGKIVDHEGPGIFSYTEEEFSSPENFYHIVNSKEYKAGADPRYGLPAGTMDSVLNRTKNLTNDNVRTLAKILGNSYRTDQAIDAAKGGSKKKAAIPAKLMLQSSFDPSTLIPSLRPQQPRAQNTPKQPHPRHARQPEPQLPPVREASLTDDSGEIDLDALFS